MKILLVQTSFLGDTVLSTPVIAAIKEKHPGCILWMMTTPAAVPLIEHDPLLDRVISYDKRGGDAGIGGIFRKAAALRAEAFDVVYSLHRSYRTALLLRLAGIPKRIGFRDARLSFLYTDLVTRPLDEHEVKRSLSLLQFDMGERNDLRLFTNPRLELTPELKKLTENGERYVVMVPGSVWATKRWSWRRYREAGEHFLKLGYHVLLLGAPDESDVSEKVSEGLGVMNLTGRTSLAESLVLIKGASLVICNDSLALHIASAFKIPTVTVFCATSPRFGFGPWKSPARVVEEEGLACKPCRRHGSMQCPTGTEACMQVPAGRVIDAAAGLIGAERASASAAPNKFFRSFSPHAALPTGGRQNKN